LCRQNKATAHSDYYDEPFFKHAFRQLSGNFTGVDLANGHLTSDNVEGLNGSAA